jgi:D-alanyl-D-alanine carboxypeptidase/D-alanyl-D-alanine-endopeptidase (penicillin-binding protein 4)
VKKFIVAIGICLGIFCQPCVLAKTVKHKQHSQKAQVPPPPKSSAPIAEQIDYVVKHAGNANMGVLIKNLATGQVIYSLNADQGYIPASNLKIFTAVAALEYLHPIFQYQTYIASTTQTIDEGGVFNGDLYVVFSGDPSLGKDDMNDLLQQLKARGINQINGNIYIDDLAFDQDAMVPAALPEDATFCFSAPIVANNLDHNCVGISAKPAARIGDLAFVQAIQSPNSVNLVNQIVTSRNSKCAITATMDENNNYVLNGCINQKTKNQAFSLPVQMPRYYSADVIKGILKDLHINFNGQVLFAKAPPKTAIMAMHQSAPLSELIKHMLKESDNLYANSILKTLGNRYFKTQGTWTNGVNAVAAILWRYNGVNIAVPALVDGAGLSRQNIITASQMLQVLSSAYQNPAISDVFLLGLPIGGVDGTLHGRFTQTAYRTRVHAKTGTMTLTGISSLSGYVINSKNQMIAFTILINGTPSHVGTYRNVEDKICDILIAAN